MARVKILLADDHPQMLEDIRGLLEPEYEVVGTVGDGESLVSAAEALHPDVIITDISMPHLNGIQATRMILTQNPDSRVILLTVHNDSALIEAGLAVGARGYVLKMNAAEDLPQAIRESLKDKRFISPVAQL